MSVVTEKSKCRILKLASMLAVTMGIIMAFYAFYIMSELYSFSATEQGKALYMAVKLLNIAFIAVIVEGVYFAIAGFYGMTNIGAVDAVFPTWSQPVPLPLSVPADCHGNSRLPE